MKGFFQFLLAAAIVFSAAGCGKPQIGIKGSGLQPCPDSPNCVYSNAGDPDHLIKPLTYTGSSQDAKNALLTALESIPRCSVKTIESNYIHAECKSLIFRFTDDLEFFLKPDLHVIHVRSASRTGYSDFGVNRKRMEKIRHRFNAEMTGE